MGESDSGLGGGFAGGLDSGESAAPKEPPYEPLIRKIEARQAAQSVAATGPGPSGPRTATGSSAGKSGGPGFDRRLSAWRTVALAAIVGAVVGALVAGLVVLAVDEDQASLFAGDTAGQISNGNGTASSTDANTTNSTVQSIDITEPGFINVKGIYDEIKASVVRVTLTLIEQQQDFSGTGFVLSADGYIATNAHVVARTASGNPDEFDPEAVEITVHLYEGASLEATVIGLDVGRDLAVLKIEANDLIPAKLGTTGGVTVGDQVVAVGNALSLGDAPTVTTGIVSATNRAVDIDATRLTGLIQTDAAINPGNSGGPLLNENGEVIGINTAIAGSNTNGLGFAISVDRAMQVIESLREGVVIETAYLGVRVFNREVWVNALEQDEANEYTDLPVADDVEGTIIVFVQEGSAADEGGIKAGDIVVRFDGIKISESQELQDAVRALLPGASTEVEVVRVSESGALLNRTLFVKLGDIRSSTN